MRFEAVRWPVPPEILQVGHNQLTLALQQRDPDLENPLRVRRIELVNRFA